MDLIEQHIDRCEIKNGVHYRIQHKSVPYGSPLSPLLGAVYLQPIDAYAKSKKIPYLRYMDDFVFFTNSKYQLKRIKRQLYRILDELKLTLAHDKTYIGNTSKGFDFLGYHFGGADKETPTTKKLSVSKISYNRMLNRIAVLYEQQGHLKNFGDILALYVTRWVRWVTSGLSQVALRHGQPGRCPLRL